MKCNLTDATFGPVPWDRFGRERFKREEMLKPTGRKNSCVHVMSLLTSKKDFFFSPRLSQKMLLHDNKGRQGQFRSVRDAEPIWRGGGCHPSEIKHIICHRQVESFHNQSKHISIISAGRQLSFLFFFSCKNEAEQFSPPNFLSSNKNNFV